MTVTRLFPSGGWEVSAIYGGQLIRRRYFGVSRRYALIQFRALMHGEKE